MGGRRRVEHRGCIHALFQIRRRSARLVNFTGASLGAKTEASATCGFLLQRSVPFDSRQRQPERIRCILRSIVTACEDQMRIAQVAPLAEAVPPKLYGGTERVVAYLTDALVELGHDVTLFASGDSLTKADLHASWPRAVRLDPAVTDHFVPLFMQLEMVARRAHEFDVIHAHLDYFGYPMLLRLPIPSLTTLHGRLDLPELPALYGVYDGVPVV